MEDIDTEKNRLLHWVRTQPKPPLTQGSLGRSRASTINVHFHTKERIYGQRI